MQHMHTMSQFILLLAKVTCLSYNPDLHSWRWRRPSLGIQIKAGHHRCVKRTLIPVQEKGLLWDCEGRPGLFREGGNNGAKYFSVFLIGNEVSQRLNFLKVYSALQPGTWLVCGFCSSLPRTTFSESPPEIRRKVLDILRSIGICNARDGGRSKFPRIFEGLNACRL